MEPKWQWYLVMNDGWFRVAELPTSVQRKADMLWNRLGRIMPLTVRVENETYVYGNPP